jgi:hypothetical protein
MESLFSLRLTHISETERAELLASPARLFTPKLRYFALSLALPLFLPVGYFSSLFFGGALDQLLVAAPVAALQFCTTAMTSGAVPLPARRLWLLAAALCLAGALPHLNLAPIGYLAANMALSLSKPGGFGDPGPPWSDVPVTFWDIANKIRDALHSGWIVAALPLIFGCLWVQHRRAAARAPAIEHAIAAALVMVLVSYDPFRADFLSVLPFSLAGTITRQTEPFSWVRVALPSFTGLAVLELAVQLGKLRAKSR